MCGIVARGHRRTARPAAVRRRDAFDLVVAEERTRRVDLVPRPAVAVPAARELIDGHGMGAVMGTMPIGIPEPLR